MKALLIVVMSVAAFGAIAQEPQVSPKCKTYLEGQARLGADLLRVLAAPSAPDFSDSEWGSCRKAVLNRIDLKANWKSNIERTKQMLRERRQRGESERAQCRAQGGRWSLAMGRCKMPNAAEARAQREYERRRREWERERARKAEELRQRQRRTSEP